jgi:hypothetical protein
LLFWLVVLYKQEWLLEYIREHSAGEPGGIIQRIIDPETHKSNSLLNVVRRISRLKVTRDNYAVKKEPFYH